MKTLAEFNGDQARLHIGLQKMRSPHPNGIACPKCGKELWDSKPMETLASLPPQKNIHCPECGYRGYRVA